ncbi:MAG: thiaminase II [Alphaproteobacteria bacterium]
MAGSSLFDRLKAAAGETWRAYVGHDFVKALGAGDLPASAFRYYLVQDYLFLRHLCRAYGLAVYKAAALDEIRQASEALQAIAAVEIAHHVGYCVRHGIDAAALDAAEEDLATTAYARYLLDVGSAGDLLDLHAALAPCVAGYGEIGRRLNDDPGTRRDGNPYREWIEMYAGEAYQGVAAAERAMLDRLGAARGGEGRLDALAAIFREATRLEAGFWDMGMKAARGGGR